MYSLEETHNLPYSKTLINHEIKIREIMANAALLKAHLEQVKEDGKLASEALLDIGREMVSPTQVRFSERITKISILLERIETEAELAILSIAE